MLRTKSAIFLSSSLRLSNYNGVKQTHYQLRSVDRLCHYLYGKEDCDGMTFVERALKGQRVMQVDNFSRYMNSQFILPTYNIFERLFSKVGHPLNNRRASVLLVDLESQIFLHVNREL